MSAIPAIRYPSPHPSTRILKNIHKSSPGLISKSLGSDQLSSVLISGELLPFPITRCPDHPILEAARRKIAAPQPVIVSERRSRESNDLDRRSLTYTPLPVGPTSSQVIPDWRRFEGVGCSSGQKPRAKSQRPIANCYLLAAKLSNILRSSAQPEDS